MGSRFISRLSRWYFDLDEGRFLVLASLLALVPRLIFVLGAGSTALMFDEIEYHLIARSLAAGHGYRLFFEFPTAWRPPGYPAFLALIYGVFGPDFRTARLVQCLVVATQPALTYLLGKRTVGSAAGRIAAVLVALYPPLIAYSLTLMSENLFISALLLSLWCLARAHEEPRAIASVGAGAVLAAAVLIRPEVTLLVPLFFAWLCWTGQAFGVALRKTVIVGLMVAVATMPWVVRNYRLTGQFVYLDTRGGFNFYVGYHENATGGLDARAWVELDVEYMRQVLRQWAPWLPAGLDDVQLARLVERAYDYTNPDQRLVVAGKVIQPGGTAPDVILHNLGMQRGLAFIRTHPLDALALIPVKLFLFWNLEQHLYIFAYSANVFGELPPAALALFFVVMLAPFALIVSFAVVGLVLPGDGRPGQSLLLLPVLLYSFVHSVLIFADARFHYQLVPVLALLGADGWLRIRAVGRVVDAPLRRRLAVAAMLVSLLSGLWVYGLVRDRADWKAIFAPGGNLSNLDY